MNLKTKLRIGFLVLAVLISVVGFLAYGALQLYKDTMVKFDEYELPMMKKLAIMNGTISDLPKHMLIVLVSDNDELVDKSIKEIDQNITYLDSEIVAYTKATQAHPMDDVQKYVQQLNESWKTTKQMMQPFLEEAEKDNSDLEKGVSLFETFNKTWEQTNDAIMQLLLIEQKRSEASITDAVQKGEQSNLFILELVIALIVSCLIIAVILTNMIMRPLQLFNKKMVELAGQDGDLTAQIAYTKKDEFGQLATSFNQMMQNFLVIMRDLHKQSLTVTDVSQHLSANTEQMSAVVSQIGMRTEVVAHNIRLQGAQISDSSVAVNEMAIGVQRIASSSNDLSTLSIKTAASSEIGQKSLQHLLGQMQTISQDVQACASLIEHLGQRSQQIESIVAVISGTASQTNLLSLNAAIEAARAGEHGRGFAVVADEVRKLAEQSEQSARQISELIGVILGETTAAVSSMSAVSLSVSTGVQVVSETNTIFGEILQSAQHVAQEVSEVSAATEQLSASAEQVAASMTEMGNAAKDVAHSTQEMNDSINEQVVSVNDIASAATNLSQAATDLMALVNKFKI